MFAAGGVGSKLLRKPQSFSSPSLTPAEADSPSTSVAMAKHPDSSGQPTIASSSHSAHPLHGVKNVERQSAGNADKAGEVRAANAAALSTPPPPPALCTVCSVSTCDAVLLPCFHLSCCQPCGRQLIEDGECCPRCSTTIQQLIPFRLEQVQPQSVLLRLQQIEHNVAQHHPAYPVGGNAPPLSTHPNRTSAAAAAEVHSYDEQQPQQRQHHQQREPQERVDGRLLVSHPFANSAASGALSSSSSAAMSFLLTPPPSPLPLSRLLKESEGGMFDPQREQFAIDWYDQRLASSMQQTQPLLERSHQRDSSHQKHQRHSQQPPMSPSTAQWSPQLTVPSTTSIQPTNAFDSARQQPLSTPPHTPPRTLLHTPLHLVRSIVQTGRLTRLPERHTTYKGGAKCDSSITIEAAASQHTSVRVRQQQSDMGLPYSTTPQETASLHHTTTATTSTTTATTETTATHAHVDHRLSTQFTVDVPETALLGQLDGASAATDSSQRAINRSTNPPIDWEAALRSSPPRPLCPHCGNAGPYFLRYLVRAGSPVSPVYGCMGSGTTCRATVDGFYGACSHMRTSHGVTDFCIWWVQEGMCNHMTTAQLDLTTISRSLPPLQWTQEQQYVSDERAVWSAANESTDLGRVLERIGQPKREASRVTRVQYRARRCTPVQSTTVHRVCEDTV